MCEVDFSQHRALAVGVQCGLQAVAGELPLYPVALPVGDDRSSEVGKQGPSLGGLGPTASPPGATLRAVTEPSREDLIEEFLATSGKYPGLAEHLDEQRNAERNNAAPQPERTVSRRRVTSRAEPAQI